MCKYNRQPIVVALLLLTFLALGSVAAEARDATKGSDNLLKGAAAGAIAGTVTQIIRGNRAPGQVLSGAAVGGAIGAGVGAYVDYREERVARESDRRYERGYDRGSYGRRSERGYDNSRGRGYREPVYYNDHAPRRARGHHRRCR